MPTLTITWHTHPELRRTVDFCDICDSLDGATWTFNTEKEPFPPLLVHPVHGIVWDCDVDDSRAHGSQRHGCYCTLSWTMTDLDLGEAIAKLRTKVQTLKSELELKSNP